MKIRIIGIMAALLLLANPVIIAETGSADEGRIRELVSGLKGWDRDAVQANSEALVKIGEPAVPYLIEALKSEDPGVRGSAARVLGDIEAEEAVIPLGELLDDPKYWVTRSAVFSLGNIGSPAAIPLLKKALKHHRAKVQEAALISLDELQEKSVMGDITNLMISSSDQYLRWKAMLVLKSLEEGAEITALLKTLNDPEAKLDQRRYATVMLGELKVEAAVPALIKAFDAKDAGLRWRAIEATGKIGAIQARPAIEKKLDDPDRDVQMFAIGTLGRLGSKDSIAALSKMLASKSGDIRKNTIRSLGEIGGPEAAAAIQPMLADRDSYVKAFAVETLVDLNQTSAVDEIKVMASDRSPLVRTAAMYALGELGPDSAKDVLQAGTTDKNRWVSEAAKEALKKTGP